MAEYRRSGRHGRASGACAEDREGRLFWQAFGLNTPGHFLIAVQGPGFQSIVDPFNDGAVVGEEDLSRLMRHVGVTERLVISPVSDRSILLRLQNNILLRARDAGNKVSALETALRMRPILSSLTKNWPERWAGRTRSDSD